MSVPGLEYLHTGMALVRKGRTPMPLVPRSSLIYGVDKPTIDTVGVPAGIAISPWNSPTMRYDMPDGLTLTDKIIYGDLFPPTVQMLDIVLNRCVLVGGTHNPTSETGILNCLSGARSGPGKVIMADCTIAPDNPQNYRDCIRGVKWEAYRCDVSGGVDGFGIFPNTGAGQSADCQVKAMGNYLHDLTYVTPDPAHASTDNQTHNDLVQIQGGHDIHLKGNWLQGTLGTIIGSPPPAESPTSGPRIAAGYCSNGVLIQQNSGFPLEDSTVIVEQNWFEGAINQANLQHGTPVFRNNRHSIDSFNRYILDYAAATVGGVGTNVWSDGPNVGQFLTTGNGGIVNL